jgi:hypothetical protein
MALRYICSLPNPGTEGTPHELFYTDDAAGEAKAEAFAQRENKPGRGVYDCIGVLKDGATRRCKETVGELRQIVLDLDLKNIEHSRDHIINCLRGLALPPSEVRDSGFGVHAVWQLKEPVIDDAGLAQAESIMKRLADLLAGDPNPTHRAALLRRPGTENSKEGAWLKCHAVEASAAEYDISEFDDLFDLYGDQPLLRSKPKTTKSNGHDPGEDGGFDGPVDVETAFAAMTHGAKDGTSVNDTVKRVIPSLLSRGEHPDDAQNRVVTEIMALAERCGLGWKHDIEVVTTRRRILSAYNNLLLKDYDPETDEIPVWLPGEFHARWIEILAAGRRPSVGFNRSGFYIRAQQESGKASTADYTQEGSAREGGAQKSEAPPKVFVLRPFVPFDLATLPPREWLYGRHYQRRTVGGTVAPGGFGKTTLCMVEAIAMATCRNLLGEQPEQQLRVWFHNGEDSRDELSRRLGAICLHFGIPQEELSGWFFMTSGNEIPLRVAKGYSNLQIDNRLIKHITEAVGDNQIDLAILDPLVTLHGVPENDTGKMDTVIRIFAGISDAQDCAIELSHHTRKLLAGSVTDYGVDDMRGAGSQKDAMRAVRMLNQMTQRDAEAVGIPEHERTTHFRVDRVKGNNAPPHAATWRRFVNVELPNGDDVGVVVPWEFPGQGTTSPEKAEAERKSEHVFLTLLDRFTAEGRNVSDRGPTSAPSLFAKEPEARLAKLGKAPLAEAMRRLFAASKIRMEAYGRTDRDNRRIARV